MSEHGRFAYDPIGRRPPFRLPDDARVAVWITPNVEHFRYDRPAISLTPITAAMQPDVLNYAWRDYGARVGIWRMMEIFEKHAIPATAALNSECCMQYPQIVEEGNRLGWEWMAHGRTNSEFLNSQPEDEERAIISEALETITEATGCKPVGWLGPALTESHVTLDLLAEAGIGYVADWCNDEQPYRMSTRAGPIVAMPYTLEVGDIPVFLEQGGTGEDFYRLIVDQFDMLYEDGATNPRVMSIAVHPFLTGHPFRARYFDRALAYMRERENVWFARGGEILDWYLEVSPPPAV